MSRSWWSSLPAPSCAVGCWASVVASTRPPLGGCASSPPSACARTAAPPRSWPCACRTTPRPTRRMPSARSRSSARIRRSPWTSARRATPCPTPWMRPATPLERVAGRDLVRGNLKARMADGGAVPGRRGARAARRGYRPRRGGRHGLFHEVRRRRVRPGAARGADEAARPGGSAGARRRGRDRRRGAHGRPGKRASRPAGRARIGVTYERIDDFLEGREVPPEVHEIIVSAYRRTAHKRALPAAPPPADSRKR